MFHLYISTWINLVNSITRCTAGLTVQVVALYEYCMVTEAAHPHITFSFAFQLNTLTDMQPVKTRV